MIEILALLLIGNVNNIEGFIGVIVSRNGRVYHVYESSPAKTLGIREGDIILSCDGANGTKCVTGPAFSVAHLTLQRQDATIDLDVVRIPRKEISD